MFKTIQRTYLSWLNDSGPEEYLNEDSRTPERGVTICSSLAKLVSTLPVFLA